MQKSVHANRMVLMKLRKRLGTAKRGHALLKHKLDELMRIYKTAREEYLQTQNSVNIQLRSVYNSYILGSGTLWHQYENTLLSSPLIRVTLNTKQERLLNLRIPEFNIIADFSSIPPYGLDETNFDIDTSVRKLKEFLHNLIHLAQFQQRIEMLESEMKITRRRVNSLEYMLIPQIEGQIKFIKMKLEEVERDNINRLMRIKDILRK